MAPGELDIYRGCTPVVDAQYGDDSDQSPAEAIIDAVAVAECVDPLDLSPLQDSIDADALNRMFEEHDGAANAEALLSFKIDNWNVFVRADGRIRVCDGTKPTDPAPVFENSTA